MLLGKKLKTREILNLLKTSIIWSSFSNGHHTKANQIAKTRVENPSWALYLRSKIPIVPNFQSTIFHKEKRENLEILARYAQIFGKDLLPWMLQLNFIPEFTEISIKWFAFEKFNYFWFFRKMFPGNFHTNCHFKSSRFLCWTECACGSSCDWSIFFFFQDTNCITKLVQHCNTGVSLDA